MCVGAQCVCGCTMCVWVQVCWCACVCMCVDVMGTWVQAAGKLMVTPDKAACGRAPALMPTSSTKHIVYAQSCTCRSVHKSKDTHKQSKVDATFFRQIPKH